MNIDEYITEFTTPEELPTATPSEKSKPSTQMKKAILADKHELTRKRDILISVAVIDGLKIYVGETYTAVQIRNMKKEKLESIFLLYQEKAGQKTTNEMMSSLVEISVKGLSYIVNIDNQEEMANDLVNSKQLRKIIGKQVAEFTEKYGDVVSYINVLFTVGKHISFSPVPTTLASPVPTTLASPTEKSIASSIPE